MSSFLVILWSLSGLAHEHGHMLDLVLTDCFTKPNPVCALTICNAFFSERVPVLPDVLRGLNDWFSLDMEDPSIRFYFCFEGVFRLVAHQILTWGLGWWRRVQESWVKVDSPSCLDCWFVCFTYVFNGLMRSIVLKCFVKKGVELQKTTNFCCRFWRANRGIDYFPAHHRDWCGLRGGGSQAAVFRYLSRINLSENHG